MIESINIDPDWVVVNYAKFEGWWEGIITKGVVVEAGEIRQGGISANLVRICAHIHNS